MKKCYDNANMLLRKFVKCLPDVKCYLFKTYCCNLYCALFWDDSTKAAMKNLTLSDPGYFRQLTIRGGGGALKAPPPYDLENYCVNLHYIIHVNFTRCFWHDPIGIFQKFAILTILQRFQNKK